MHLGAAIRSGAKWLAFGKLANRLWEFAFGVILARLLTPADFGMIATVSVFTGFVGMFTAGGMGQSLIRAKEADEEDFTAVFTLQLALGVLVYLGFFAAAPLIARAFAEPLYTDLVRVMALSFLLRPLYVMRMAWLNRHMQFQARTQVEIAMGFVSGVSASLMAWMGLGVWSLALSGLLNALLQNLWLSRLVPLAARLNPRTELMRRHSGFGARIVANDFLSYLNREGRTLMVSKLAGASALGLFNKADSLARLPNQLFMQPTMEPLFRALGKTQDDPGQVRYLYYRSLTLLSAYTLPLYAILWWVAEPFISVVYGPKWVAAADPMRILVLAGPFLNLLFPSSVLLAAQNRLGLEIKAQAIHLPLALIAVFIGLQYGLAGLAWAVFAATALLTLHLLFYAHRCVRGRWADLAQAIAPGVLMGCAMTVALGFTHGAVEAWPQASAVARLLVMLCVGGAAYALFWLFQPFAALRTESQRWRALLARAAHTLRGPLRLSRPRS
ncbi:MAG: lipopolysaccharide biosynthesis protein [Thiobacillaceae bacterium]|nr:lipopolysaccharide biosynthesis protein [Thiobacillaceae bacterium]